MTTEKKNLQLNCVCAKQLIGCLKTLNLQRIQILVGSAATFLHEVLSNLKKKCRLKVGHVPVGGPVHTHVWAALIEFSRFVLQGRREKRLQFKGGGAFYL